VGGGAVQQEVEVQGGGRSALPCPAQSSSSTTATINALAACQGQQRELVAR
jgi:hypothetical protein